MVASRHVLSSATGSAKVTKRSLTKEARPALIVSSPLASHRMMRSACSLFPFAMKSGISYLCPAQEKLKRYANVRSTSRVQYRAPKGSCVACAFRAECAPSGGERTIHRSWAQEFVEVNKERWPALWVSSVWPNARPTPKGPLD